MKGNLLIVDDEPMLLDALQEKLQKHCDHTFTAEDATKALILLSKEEIHCIICDINMPRMTGVEMLRIMRERGLETPLIFFTGHGNPELMLEAAKYGAFDFLDKPNMTGLDEVVLRGLKHGLASPDEGPETSDEHQSEYSRMLAELQKKNPS